jgi:hypothetical protein
VAASGEDTSAGTAATRADLVALRQAKAVTEELRDTVAALESQVHSDEIAAHSLNAALLGKGEEIARLEALRGTDGEE